MKILLALGILLAGGLACRADLAAPYGLGSCVIEYSFTTLAGGPQGTRGLRVVLYRADHTYQELFNTQIGGLFGGVVSSAPRSGAFTYVVDPIDATHATIYYGGGVANADAKDELYFTNATGGLQETPVPIVVDGTVHSFGYYPLRDSSGGIAFSSRCTLASGGSATSGVVIAPGASRWVLIRAVGASLADYGVSATAVKPSFTVYDSNGNVVANSVVWSADLNLVNGFKTVFSMVGDFPLNDGSDEGVAVLPLAPGAYTAVFKASGGGEIMCEVYLLPY